MEKMFKNPRLSNRGFQLIEQMMVCLLIILVTTVGIDSALGWIEVYRLDNAVRMFSTRLSEMRSLSISLNYPIAVRISESRKEFSFSDRNEDRGIWTSLPKGVSFTGAPLRTVAFYPRGNAALGGTFRLSNSTGCFQVVVSPTGRIRWERLE